MLTITAVFLAAVFIAAEFYRFKHRITGSVLKICSFDGDTPGLMGARVQVATAEAGEIAAFVSSCQLCASPIEVGDAVSLVPGPNGYIVKSPLISWRRRERRRLAGSGKKENVECRMLNVEFRSGGMGEGSIRTYNANGRRRK